MKGEKYIRKNIGVGSVINVKVREIEDNTRDGRRKSMRKEVVVFVQGMAGKNKLLVQFEDGQKKEISSVSFSCVCSKEEVCLDMDEPISDLPQK